ncbi:hypothetical protein EKO23_13015 [Nocardioides guangzhouensis]|uniref:Sulfotransferase family protein n=1 Tax=Nocardioides guangzhouensis TaxID=2497878 RepID=A0A4Q4ZBT7_9ACTN|nr:hypothetical protein [Nocardioides guangzhouensis]RYP85392.1 hypothetical protein EKO23_13015 [Nocardioides guangzhouensis]
MVTEPEPEQTADPGDRSLVLVLGPGRSGTSTMAGALAHSGYTVPQAIKGNETNPLGFFEPRWLVNFQSRQLKKARVGNLDADPEAVAALESAIDDDAFRRQLARWLMPELEAHGRLVLKDPRTIWFKGLWDDVAQAQGLDPRFVIMLRHPAEVSSSRSTYYSAREAAGVAGWINVALMTERLTRGSRRAFVHYPNLTTDWRSELVRLRSALGITLDPAPEEKPHPVDDFIDPNLRRMRPEWDKISAPQHLRDLADRTHAALSVLADEESPDASAFSSLDDLRAEYTLLHADAMDMVGSSVRRLTAEARRTARRKARAEFIAQQEQAAAARTPGPRDRAAALLGRLRRR